MPLIKGAIKKLKQDRAKTERNKAARASLRTTLKRVTENPDENSLTTAYSVLDKAVKHGLIKKGKADRAKSRLSKRLKTTAPKATAVKKVKPTKKATKKSK